MSKRASGGTLSAFLILAAIVGFAVGAYLGTQSGDDAQPSASSTDPAGTDRTDEPSDEDGSDPSANPSETPASDAALTLSIDQSSVAANERIDYSGTVTPAEEGVSVRLERSVDGGDWQPFPDASDPIIRETDADGAFSGYVLTGRSGENSFRVVRVDDESVVSDPVSVTVE